MSLVHKLGKDLANPEDFSAKGVQTGVTETRDDNLVRAIIVEGPLETLVQLAPEKGAVYSAAFPYIPNDGSYVQQSRVVSDGHGGGTLTVHCICPGFDSAQSPSPATNITYRIDMAEERTDLMAHPEITKSPSTVAECLKWLATDDAKKVDENGDYQYDNGNGTFTIITDAMAEKFCNAWMHGIKTFNRYFPVIEKISTYKRVPGLNMDGASITGGAPRFSDDIGKWDAPSISLAGYGSPGGFFKSKDSWVQNAKSSWTRTEQWVWTPDGAESDYGWIYAASAQGANNGGGGNA